MQHDLVIARAFRGEPVKMVATMCARRLVYVADPSRIAAVEAGDSEPVGFPVEDVFRFDGEAYERLRQEWEQRHATDRASWRGLQRYASSS